MASEDREVTSSSADHHQEAEHTHHRTVVVFVSPEPNHQPSQQAFAWAQNNLIRSGDAVLLVTCVPAQSSALTPAMGMGRLGSAAVSAELEALERCRKSVLHSAKEVMKEYKSKAKPDSWELHTRVLEQSYGSVAETLVQWANRHAIEDVVVGQRHVGTFKGAMLALVGKGSVSKYVVNHVHCPVVVVKDDCTPNH